jgi:hypothetical protein
MTPAQLLPAWTPNADPAMHGALALRRGTLPNEMVNALDS